MRGYEFEHTGSTLRLRARSVGRRVRSISPEASAIEHSLLASACCPLRTLLLCLMCLMCSISLLSCLLALQLRWYERQVTRLRTSVCSYVYSKLCFKIPLGMT